MYTCPLKIFQVRHSCCLCNYVCSYGVHECIYFVLSQNRHSIFFCSEQETPSLILHAPHGIDRPPILHETCFILVELAPICATSPKSCFHSCVTSFLLLSSNQSLFFSFVGGGAQFENSIAKRIQNTTNPAEKLQHKWKSRNNAHLRFIFPSNN